MDYCVKRLVFVRMCKNDFFTSQTHEKCVSLVVYIAFRKNNNNSNTLHYVHYYCALCLSSLIFLSVFFPRLMCCSQYNLYDCLCTSRYTYIMHLLTCIYAMQRNVSMAYRYAVATD